MRMHLALLLTLIASPHGVAGGEDQLERSLLDQTMESYEQALGECMNIGRDQALPDDEVIKALRRYPARDVETFLITHAAEMEDQCAADELGELATVLHLLARPAESDPDLANAISETRQAIFSDARWGLKKLYLQLPTSMKAELNSYPVFQRPFDSLRLREILAGQ